MAKIIWKSKVESDLEQLRARREKECFAIINRGGLWYDMRTEQEKTDLLNWYSEWLEVTETGVIPEKPQWIK